MIPPPQDDSRIEVAIIGGGGAGLLAGIAAARDGARTVVFERNARPGLKVAIAGGGRCNFSNTYEPREFIREFGDLNAQRLGHALRAFPNRELIEMLLRHGVRGVMEGGYRLYTESRRGRDVVEALRAELASSGARLETGATISGLVAPADAKRIPGFTLRGAFAGCEGGREARAVIICTGGLSYPKTGSTGDGFTWARALGHTITELRPGLVGLATEDDWPKALSGVSCPDVRVTLRDLPAAGAHASGSETTVSAGGRHAAPPLAAERADILFTHFGLSGPAVIDLSLVLVRRHLSRARVELDFFPDQSTEALDRRLTAAFRARPHGGAAQALEGLPARLAEALVGLLGEEGRRKAGQFQRGTRRRLAELLKAAPLTVSGTREIEHGEVTVGGVSWDEIDPATMESRLVPGLFFAGEILDVAGRCGGFNLQSAFSTGYLAGRSAARRAALGE